MKTFPLEQYEVWTGEIPPFEPWHSDYAEFEAHHRATRNGYDFHNPAVLQNVPGEALSVRGDVAHKD